MDAGQDDAGMDRGTREGLAVDDSAVDDLAVDDLAMGQAVGERVRGRVVVRDGMLVHLVPDDVMPPGAPFEGEPFDDAWYRGTVRGWETDDSAGPGHGPEHGSDTGVASGPASAPDTAADWLPDVPPDWPPDAVPVFLWPQEILRQALRDVPGPRLARVVAEAIDLAGDLDPDPDHGVVAGSGVSGSGVLADLSDDTLGDVMVACGRLQSWAAGVQARVVAERAGRESHPLAHNSLVGQVTGELVVTEPEASEVVVRAESGTLHPTVIQALLAGRIDVRKAHTLLRSATQLTVAERAEAIQKFLPRAPRHTWKWLQNKMLAFAKNRHGAAATAKAETARRSVQVDRAHNDMGWLSAYLPATDAAAVWGVVDDMAHQLRHVTGEDRTLGQLRADSLTGIITGRLLPADRFTDPEPDTDPAAEPADTEPAGAESAGAEQSSGAEASEAAEAAEASEGADVPVCTCGGRAPVQQVVVQKVVQEVVRPVRITPTRPVIRVTIPATALLGLDDAPGHLDGYGPIPADTATAIAQDATWQRLLTDPVTGILTDYSTTTYQPGKTLRAAVEARDEHCMFGWCDIPASRCDLDHIHPFDHDKTNHDKTNHDNASTDGTRDGQRGQTNARNLHALCRKHHLLKTHAGWGVIRDPDTGVTTWTAPTGRTHVRPPTALDTHVEIDEIDPDTSNDLTLHALTGRHLPRPYQTTEPGAMPSTPDEPTDQPTDTNDPDAPPF
ncbi:HNH endonuclease [Promicromonospora sp. NPDC057138]|uniref:HNH endonuclease signature motif containing protein n=1 Tax=Promicromonospora sp. NPDC057138 TaxID=3346031 RepID=UPI00363325A1